MLDRMLDSDQDCFQDSSFLRGLSKCLPATDMWIRTLRNRESVVMKRNHLLLVKHPPPNRLIKIGEVVVFIHISYQLTSTWVLSIVAKNLQHLYTEFLYYHIGNYQKPIIIDWQWIRIKLIPVYYKLSLGKSNDKKFRILKISVQICNQSVQKQSFEKNQFRTFFHLLKVYDFNNYLKTKARRNMNYFNLEFM